MSFQLVRSPNPPQGCVASGFQNDGAGTVWTAVAHTNHGDIPGKAIGNNCWYSYGGKEESTNNFSYLTMRNWKLVRNTGSPPQGAIAAGFQNDGAGTVWAAIAHTNHGEIPGKAIGNNCWYPYGGKEESTNNFSWIVSGYDLVRNSGSPPPGAIASGFQNDGAGTVWSAVAHTNQGEIPGKAIGNNCWYPYGGKEESTNNFSWVVGYNWRLERNGGFAPQGSIASGFQNDGAGTVWSAVAHTNHGDIPGKAIGNNCWYSYGGREESTNNFSWLVC